MAHSIETVRAFQQLQRAGKTQREIAGMTGVPLGTIRAWSRGRLPRAVLKADHPDGWCGLCGAERHAFESLPASPYAYLLGTYLGDGDIFHGQGRTRVFRLSLDLAYPQIIEEAATAIETIRGRRPWIGKHRTSECAVLVSYWKQWECYFPQHGRGRKHERRIELVGWQRCLIRSAPGALLRGLIHSDGWRGLNRVHVKGRDYAYPRYQFSSRSDDIRRIFTDTCDLIGVEWRPWGRFHVSVARRESVEELDRFVGIKR